jgi:DNA adenine methylase
MDLDKLTKNELLLKCDELKILKCKSKNKIELIKLIKENILLDKKTNNVSPLRYPGGKTRACKILEDIILKNFDIVNYDTLISPFFGGGSFEFYLQNKYNFNLIVNDKFTPLYNFWNQVKIDKNILCEELRKFDSISKEQFEEFRKNIMGLNEDVLNQSIQYFIINRCSFSGSTLSGGFSKESSENRFTKSSIEKIENLIFDSIELHNKDFSDFMKDLSPEKKSKSLMFVDPPYYLEKKSKLYGNNGDLHENFNHQLLFEMLNSRGNWILTYNNCEYIKNLYKDYTIIETNWSYGMNKSKSSCEIVIYKK